MPSFELSIPLTEEEWLAGQSHLRMGNHAILLSFRKFTLVEAAQFRLDWEKLSDQERWALGIVESHADDADRQGQNPNHGAIRKATQYLYDAASKRGGLETFVAVVVRSLHEVYGNPFRPVTTDPSWLTPAVTALARGMYESRDFSAMPILADALQDAGCDNDDILNHCRGPGPHVRGCWVVDLVLGKS
jgi:hypothetical protein